MTLETESLEYIAWANDEIKKKSATIAEMLEALEAVYSWLDDFGANAPQFSNESELSEMVRAAIAKANGEKETS